MKDLPGFSNFLDLNLNACDRTPDVQLDENPVAGGVGEGFRRPRLHQPGLFAFFWLVLLSPRTPWNIGIARPRVYGQHVIRIIWVPAGPLGNL